MSGSTTPSATREQFWERAHMALDERRDPLGDEQVRAWVLEHPADALELCDLSAALRKTERADNPLRMQRRSRHVPVAAAALLGLVALGAWFALRPPARATPALTAAQELELHPAVPAPRLGSVHSWQLVSTIESAGGMQTVRASEGRIEIANEYSTPLGALAQASVLATHEESWAPQ